LSLHQASSRVQRMLSRVFKVSFSRVSKGVS
jgi:hypothetical protein